MSQNIGLSSSAVRSDYVTPRTKDRYYIDVNTRDLTGLAEVFGTNTNFSASIQTLTLDPNKHYTIKVDSIRYRQATVGDGVYLVVLSDIAENIRINNTNSSVIFQSNTPDEGVNDYVYKDDSNNGQLVLPLRSKVINQINVQLVRSDNGAKWPIADMSPSDATSITFLIESI